jgi:hypothetical protein
MPDERSAVSTDWLRQLELGARALAVTVGSAYVVGFLIVTTHHARLGIWQFDLLRPRILSAGATYLVLTLFAVATSLGVHRLLGVGGIGLPWRPHQKIGHGIVARALCSVTTAYGFSLFIRGMLGEGESWRFWLPWQPWPVMLMSGAALSFVDRYIDRAPGTIVAGCALLSISIGYLVWSFASPFTMMLALWFWLVMLLTLVAYAIGRFREALLQNQRLESILLAAVLGLIYLYSVSVYGAINPWLGGGAPMPATFLLSASAPEALSKKLTGRLLEETSHGFYLLPHESQSNPLFLPREAVSAIYFTAR